MLLEDFEYHVQTAKCDLTATRLGATAEFDRDGAVCLQQTIRIKPGAVYHMAGQIRAADAQGHGCLQMAFVDSLGGALEDAPDIARSETVTGTTAWVRVAFETTAPAAAAAMEVRLFMTGKGTVFAKGLMVHR